jgi:hypothetical protein
MKNIPVQKGIAHIALVVVAVVVVALIIMAFVSGAANVDFSITRDGETEQGSEEDSAERSTLDRSNVEAEKYENSDYNISLYYPNDWEVQEGSGYDFVASFLSPLEFDGDDFRENVILSVTDMSQFEGITVSQTMDAWVQQTESDTTFTGFEVVSREGATLDGHSAEQIVYVAERDGFKARGSTIVVLVDMVAYVFTYTAAVGSYDTFYRDLIGILDNVQFIL